MDTADTNIMKPQLRFYNPFPGKPTKIVIPSLFLISPETLIKIAGITFSGIFKQDGRESLFKRLQKASAGESLNQDQLGQDFLKLIPQDSEFFERFSLAVNGDKDARTWVENQGIWSMFYLHKTLYGEKLSYSQSFLVQIEKACLGPEQRFKQGDYRSVAKELRQDELMRRLITESVIEQISNLTSQISWDFISSSVAIEILISHLAAIDAEHSMDSQVSNLMSLLPSDGKNPTQRYFAWIKHQIGAKSIGQILEDPRAEKLKIDLQTLKQWSSGRYFPSEIWLEPVLKAFLNQKTIKQAWVKYFGARYLNFIGYTATRIEGRVRTINAEHPEFDTKPWPHYPFENTNIEDWCSVRYPYWYEYHRAQIIKQGQ